MKIKMEDMANEFGDMLKETLDRMRERIEVKEDLKEEEREGGGGGGGNYCYVEGIFFDISLNR